MAVAVKFQQKQEDKPGKSFGLSFILHAILLLIAFFLVLPNTPPVQDPPLPKDEEFLVKLDVQAFKERAKEIKQVPRKARDVQFVNSDDGGNKGTKGRADEGEAAPDVIAAPPAPVENPNPVPATAPEVIKPSTTPVLNTPKPVIKAPSQVITQKTEDDIPTVKPTTSTSSPSTSTPSKPNTGTTVPSKSGTTPTTNPGPTKSGGGAPNSNGGTAGAPPGRTSNQNGNGTGGGKTGTGGGVSGGNDASEGTGNTSSGTGEYDGSGNGVFGRKVIYKDNSATFKAVDKSGIVVVKACVNQGGIVTYAELLNAETTIKDKNTLKLFLKAAYKWKLQPDLTAPKEQCGKFKFKIDNTINNKLKG